MIKFWSNQVKVKVNYLVFIYFITICSISLKEQYLLNNSYFHNISYNYLIIFSGLSLVLNKAVCDWTRQTLNLSELKGERPAEPDLIHTSCRSESSNISLVVLDNELVYPNKAHARWQSGIHFQSQPSALLKLLRPSPGFTSSGQSPTCLSPQTWWANALEPGEIRKTETPANPVLKTAGHLSGEIGTSSHSVSPSSFLSSL